MWYTHTTMMQIQSSSDTILENKKKFTQDNIMMQIGFKNYVRIRSEDCFSSWK